MIIDKGVVDESLVLQTFGIQINIAALIEEINSHSDQYQVHECETGILIGINRTDGINVEVLKNMNEARLNQPILITAINGYEWVIDGNHRLLKRHELEKKMTNYIPINGNQLDPFVSELL